MVNSQTAVICQQKMKAKLQILLITLLFLSCNEENNRSFEVKSIEKIYFEPRDHEIILDFEENNYSIEHFIEALNSAKSIGKCKFYPKAWVTIKNANGDSTIVKLSNRTFKFNDDECYKIGEHYDVEFLNQNSRISIETIEDLFNLKQRGIGISTFGASNSKFEVDKPLKNFGSYQIMDTTEINEIQFLRQLNIMTDTDLMKFRYENQDEQLVSFETRNERLYFGNQIGIGFIFKANNYQNIDTLGQTEFQFQKKGLDYIVKTNFEGKINHITVGQFKHKKRK